MESRPTLVKHDFILMWLHLQKPVSKSHPQVLGVRTQHISLENTVQPMACGMPTYQHDSFTVGERIHTASNTGLELRCGQTWVTVLYCVLNCQPGASNTYTHSVSCIHRSSLATAFIHKVSEQIVNSGKSPEKEMATHPSIFAWRIPWTEEPGGLQSMGSPRIGHNRVAFTPSLRSSVSKELC